VLVPWHQVLSAFSHLSLSSGFERCGIAIEDDMKRSGEMEVNRDDIRETDEMKLMKVDHEVMDVLKSVLDGEFADEDLLTELLK
jgi:hypothetical protein